jgi:hypothetical protein
MKKLFFAIALLLTIQTNAFNITYYWIGGASGNWTDGSKWSLTPGGGAANAYPGANDLFYFNTGDSIVVNYDMPGHATGFKDFKISNQTKLTLINTVSVNTNRWFTINNGNSSAYYEVVEAGSVLTLMSNSNLNHFSLGEDGFSSGRMVFNGKIICLNQAVNTNYGPRLNAFTDSIIINDLFYYGESTQGYQGSNPIGNKFRFGPNGIYQIDRDGGIFLFAKWEKGSLIKITGTRSNFPSYWNGFYNSGNPLGGLLIDAPFASVGFNGYYLNMPANLVFQNNITIRNLGPSRAIYFTQRSPLKITIQGDLIIEKGQVVLTANSYRDSALITVEGGLNLQSAASLYLTQGSNHTNLKVAGNVTLNGGMYVPDTSDNPILELNGTQIQSFEQAGTNSCITLRINNTSRILALTDINWSQCPNSRIEFIRGRIDVLTNNKKCYVQNPEVNAIMGGSAVSHVLGTLVRATNSTNNYWFPISSNDSDFAPIQIKPELTNIGANWETSFEHVNPQSGTGIPSGISRIEPYRWNIVQTGNTLNASSITFFNGDVRGNQISANPASARVLRFDGSNWTNLGGTYTNNNSISNQTAPISSFGIFSLGIESNQPFLAFDRNLDFGNRCVQTNSIDSISIQGSNLTAGNLLLSGLNGFQFSLTSNGTYASTLSIPQPGGPFSPTWIYVSFQPAAVQSYNGSIQLSGGGATAVSINLSGAGIGIVEPQFNPIDPICAGATLTPLPSISNNGINGSWSPAPNNTTTTTYTFTPDAGQCADTAQLTIAVNGTITPTFEAVQPICIGDVLSPFPTTSLNGISGSWSPAPNNTTTTTYTFTPSAGQCAQSTTRTIEVDALLKPNFAPIILPICLSSSFNPLSNTSLEGIVGSWSPAFNSNANTRYTFTPEPGQCADTSSILITVASCGALIYPNPSSGYCWLNLGNLPTGNYQIVIYDEKGARVWNAQKSASTHQLDLRKLKKAIYLIQVFDQEGNVILKSKLMVHP